jgi:hypothetical protein
MASIMQAMVSLEQMFGVPTGFGGIMSFPSVLQPRPSWSAKIAIGSSICD